MTITDGIKRQQTATDLHGYPRTRLHEWVIMDMRCDMKRDSNEIDDKKVRHKPKKSPLKKGGGKKFKGRNTKTSAGFY